MGFDKAVVVDVDANPNLRKSLGNIHTYKYLSQAGINIYDLLKFGNLIITETALKNIAARLSGGANG